MDAIADRISNLEERMSSMETTITDLKSGAQAKIVEQFVDHVPLVGLKEAIIKRHYSMKCIWAFLFVIGVCGTGYYIYENTIEYLNNPTATIIKFVRQPFYVYPPLILCPGMWLNSEKAFSMGLSVNALKYSLAYADLYSVDPTMDVAAGRQEFFEFYKSKNYSRLLDYFLDISIDIVAKQSAKSANSSYKCYMCQDGTAPLEKVFIDGMICYVAQLAPENAKRYETWSGLAPGLSVKIQDHTAGIMKTSANWKVYLMPDKFLVQPNFPPIYLSPYTVSTLKMNAQKFLTLKNEKSPCLLEHEVPANYSSARCTIECLHKLYNAVYKCHLLAYYSYDHDHSHAPLHEYCNYLDQINGRDITHFDLWNGDEPTVMETADGEACVQRCPHTCNRTIYTSTLDSQYPIVADKHDGKYAYSFQPRLHNNISKIVVLVDNTATELGGILVENEIVTLSFTGYLSNIGGTLCLFLGCTFMTIFQILLFCIEQMFVLIEKKRVKKEEGTQASP